MKTDTFEDIDLTLGSTPEEGEDILAGAETPTKVHAKATEETGSAQTIELKRKMKAVTARIKDIKTAVVDEGKDFNSDEFVANMAELIEAGAELDAAEDNDRRAANDRRRDSEGPVADPLDAKQVQNDVERATFKAIRMCLDGQADGFTLTNRRIREVPEGETRSGKIALTNTPDRILEIGEVQTAYGYEMPYGEVKGAVSHKALARFDGTSASTDAGAPLGIIFGDQAEQDMRFFGSLESPQISDVWYRTQRADGAGQNLQDIDIPQVNNVLTAGQSTENADMTEDDTDYTEVKFGANSIDLAKNLSHRYAQKTQLYDFVEQEMKPVYQGLKRLTESLLVTGDGSDGTSSREGQPKGYLTALDALTGNDISVTKSTANSQVGFKGTIQNLEDAMNTLDVGYRGSGSVSFIMNQAVWGYFSSLRSDELRQISPFLDRMSEETKNLMLGIMGNFDVTNRIVLHPNYPKDLTGVGTVVFSYGPTQAFTVVDTGYIWVFSKEINVKKRGDYLAGYRYIDSDLRWTSIGAPVGLLGKTV